MGRLGSRIETSPGFAYHKPNPQSVLRLFCFPYAGAGIVAYRYWANQLSPEIEVCPVTLPGRGHRIRQPLLSDCSALADVLVEDVRAYAQKPFAFFGHSMGALLAFEIARNLSRNNECGPVHLFVSGRPAPQWPRRRLRKVSDLSEEEFMEELRHMNGTPQQVLERPDMVKSVLPVLRADFSVVESYTYQGEAAALPCPISAYSGLDDSIPREAIEAWGVQTKSAFASRFFPGGHFFIQSAEEMLLAALRAELGSYINQFSRKGV